MEQSPGINPNRISEEQVNGVTRDLIDSAHPNGKGPLLKEDGLTPDERAFENEEGGQGKLEDPAEMEVLGIEQK